MVNEWFSQALVWITPLFSADAAREMLVFLGCGLVAWILTQALSRAAQWVGHNSVLFGDRLLDGLLWPLIWLALGFVSKLWLASWSTLFLYKLLLPVLIVVVVVRLSGKVLQLTFKKQAAAKTLGRVVAWLAWITLFLWITGWLPRVLQELEGISWSVGGTDLTLLKLIEGSITSALVLLLALWLSAAVEARLMRSGSRGELSWRIALSNATRAFLLFIGVLVALSAVGIDLTALSVLGGALGVGIGFGLQRVAANYVSGFVILAEGSVRIGDTVQVDNFTGVITSIRARHTVIRSLAGHESIVPNELLITNRVENLSLADAKVWLSTRVQVSYDADVEKVMALLSEAALKPPRVLRDPAPGIQLSRFADDGLEFTVGFWITDPENGTGNVISAVNLEILRLLREHQIVIPYPQRVLHQAP